MTFAKKPEKTPPPVEVFVTKNEIIAAAEAAKKQVEICVPSRDYYSRAHDWGRDTLAYIDVDLFMDELKKLL